MSKFGSASSEEPGKLAIDDSGNTRGLGVSNLARTRGGALASPETTQLIANTVGRTVPSLAIAGGVVAVMALLLGQKPDQQLLNATIENQKQQTAQLKEFKKVLETATRPSNTVALLNIGGAPQQQPAFQPQQQAPVQFYQAPAPVAPAPQPAAQQVTYSAELASQYTACVAEGWQSQHCLAVAQAVREAGGGL
jgi:hypothetical protein